jgi:2-dehydropantoate 2-reductase
MRICVVGAGAMGGFLGVKLAISGQDVTFIDIGDQLCAIQEKGIKLIMEDGTEHILRDAKATDSFPEAGPHDVVILALKAHHIQEVAEKMPALYESDTYVITIQNGIPWWYFQKHGGKFEGRRLVSLDPTGIIEANIPSERIIGCIAYPAATVSEPGVVRQVEGIRFPLGELDDKESDRCLKLVQVLLGAGFKSYILDNIRSEIWLKAWGTLSFNPISALTHATLVDICRFPETRHLAAKMMKEAQEIAGKLGIQFRHTIERRITGAEGVGAHKTSMLQDVEAGRALETEALIGSVMELAQLTETPAPAIEAVNACAKLLNKTFLNINARVGLIPLID